MHEGGDGGGVIGARRYNKVKTKPAKSATERKRERAVAKKKKTGN